MSGRTLVWALVLALAQPDGTASGQVSGLSRAASSAATRASSPPRSDWQDAGDALLRAGFSHDAIFAYQEALQHDPSARVEKRLALALAMQTSGYELALPHAILAAREDRFDRGSRELVAWLHEDHAEAARAAREASALPPRDDIERAASLLGAVRRAGPLAELLRSWPAPAPEAVPLPPAPRIYPLLLLDHPPAHSRDAPASPEPSEDHLARFPLIDWRVGFMPSSPAMTLPAEGLERIQVFHSAASRLLARQSPEEARRVALAGMPDRPHPAAADLAVVVALSAGTEEAADPDWVERALELDPHHSAALRLRSLWLQEQGRLEEAAEKLEQASLTAGDPGGLHEELARLHSKMGNPVKALTWARLATSSRPPNAKRLASLAEMLEASGPPEAARPVWGEAALRACKDFVREVVSPGLRNSLGLGLDPSLLEFLASSCRARIGSVAGGRSAWHPEALEHEGAWLAPLVSLALARSRFSAGDHAGAVEAADRARAMELAELSYWSTLCDAHLIAAAAHDAMGRRDEARERLSRAIQDAHLESELLVSRVREEVARYRRVLREGGAPPPLSVEISSAVQMGALDDPLQRGETGTATIALAALLLEKRESAEALAILRSVRSLGPSELYLRAVAEWRAGDVNQAAIAAIAAWDRGVRLPELRELGQAIADFLRAPGSRAARALWRTAVSTSTPDDVAMEWLGRADTFQAASALAGLPDGPGDPYLAQLSRTWERYAELRLRHRDDWAASRALRHAAACAIAAGERDRARRLSARGWVEPRGILDELTARFSSVPGGLGRRPRKASVLALASLYALLVILAVRFAASRIPTR